MSGAAPPLVDRVLDRLDAIVPKPSALAFALRIWLASVLALYAGFWLQLDGASTAATAVAILSQPRRGQAISKGINCFLGTIIGGAVSIVLMGLFGQDRVLLLVSFGLWLGLCVFVAQFLQDTRAFGAMLSGYTVAIIALAHIDTPQYTFDAACARIAAITLGIISITFINDALASPSTWQALKPRLAAAFSDVQAFMREALASGDPGPDETAALICRIAPMRTDANAIRGEFDDGIHRAAGARSAIAALYVLIAATRAFAVVYGRLRDRSPAVGEAHAICMRAASDDASASVLERDDARLRELVDAAIRDPRLPLDDVMVLQGALDVLNATIFAIDGLHALSKGKKPLRDITLPMHRDLRVAVRAAFRVVVAFAICCVTLIASGLPQASFALVQVAVICTLSSTVPDPRKYALGVLIGAPLAALNAWLVLFVMLPGNQGFPLLAIAIAPGIFIGCFMTLNPPTFGAGLNVLIYSIVLIAPRNPQIYDLQTFLMNVILLLMSALILFLAVRLILPVTPSQHRAFALHEARRDLADALIGEGGDPIQRTSLNADRLLQFMAWNSGSGTVRRASLAHAFAMSQLESAAARAHAQLGLLWCVPSLREAVAAARKALASRDSGRLEDSANALIRMAAREEQATRMIVARAATDLATAARVMVRYRRFFQRLALPSS